ncbi:MAG: hypothetical protein JSS87_09565 [Acidobacteria bacterium]|nr:hypothetical protein [Acidobacteriota bacterium]
MRLRSAIAACLLLVVAAISVRETRCGSECQAAAALFAANASLTRNMAAMPGMEDCPMAKMGQSVSVSGACVQRMVHAPEAAQTEEHVRAPEFSIAPLAIDSLVGPAVPVALTGREIVDVSPPERTGLIVSLQSALRI